MTPSKGPGRKGWRPPVPSQSQMLDTGVNELSGVVNTVETLDMGLDMGRASYALSVTHRV